MCVQIDGYHTDRQKAIITCPPRCLAGIINDLESIGCITTISRRASCTGIKLAVDMSALEAAWYLSRQLHGKYEANNRGGYTIRPMDCPDPN